MRHIVTNAAIVATVLVFSTGAPSTAQSASADKPIFVPDADEIVALPDPNADPYVLPVERDPEGEIRDGR